MKKVKKCKKNVIFLKSSDLFVLLDDVQFSKNDFQNRNIIRTIDGSMWLTVPIHSSSKSMINQINIVKNSNWISKHEKSIEVNYSQTQNYDRLSKSLDTIYSKNYELLVDLNIALIQLICKELDLKTKLILSSSLGLTKKGSERILEICNILNADTYLSGIGGKNYLKLEDFETKNIKIKFQNFQHPVYKQFYQPFIPNMSIIDLLFNEGNHSKEILKKASNF